MFNKDKKEENYNYKSNYLLILVFLPSYHLSQMTLQKHIM